MTRHVVHIAKMHSSGGNRLYDAAAMEVENKLNNTQRTAETDTLTTTAAITTGFYKFLARFSGKFIFYRLINTHWLSAWRFVSLFSSLLLNAHITLLASDVL